MPTKPITLLAVGETMAVVTPMQAERVVDADVFRVDAGGAESNLAAHVAAAGHGVRWHSRLGDDALGERVLRRVAARGVDVSTVTRDPERPTGLYVKDPGHGVRYYRAGSAASALGSADAEAVDLEGIRVVHVSGITAAISASGAAFVDALITRAQAAGVLVSFDVNHRAALWSHEVAAAALDALSRRADILFVGRDEAEGLWGTSTDDDIRARFPEVPELIVKDGDVGATTYIADGKTFVPAQVVDVVEVVGAGDAFGGGYLAALLRDDDVTARLLAGHARAALTLRTTGDFPDVDGS